MNLIDFLEIQRISNYARISQKKKLKRKLWKIPVKLGHSITCVGRSTPHVV